MHHADDNPIIRLAADPDDRLAWAAVVSEYGSLCWRIALRMLGDQHAAEDAVQDCLLAVRAGARRFKSGADPDGSAVAWVARVSVNTCHHHRRRQRQRAGQALPVNLAAPESAEVQPPDLLPMLRDALADLPRNQREAVSLRYLAGLDHESVAQALDIDVGAARVRVHRGLIALRSIFERRGAVLSLAGLTATMDAAAAEAVTAPPTNAVTAWVGTALPSLTIFTRGVIVAMFSIFAASVSVYLICVSIGTRIPSWPLSSVFPMVADNNHGAKLQAMTGWDWLATHQLADGSWPVQPTDQSLTEPGDQIAVTARAILCFLGAGYDQKMPSKYKICIGKGLAWLTEHADSGGNIETNALRALAVAEAFSMSNDQNLWPVSEAAMRDLLDARVGVAWPVRRGDNRIDTLVTTHAIMAMHMFKKGGRLGEVVDKPLADVTSWLRQTWSCNESIGFPRTTLADGTVVGLETADAAATVCAFFCDLYPDEAMSGLFRRMSVTVATLPRDRLDSETWAFTTHVAYWLGEETWAKFSQKNHRNRNIQDSLLAMQEQRIEDVINLTLCSEVSYRYLRPLLNAGQDLPSAPQGTN